MQKKIIALAVAGLMSGAAFAQSNVTIYGNIDQSIEMGSYGNGSKTMLTGSGYATQRLGFQGEEALGGGLKAVWRLEAGINADKGTAGAVGLNNVGTAAGTNNGWVQLFDREAFLGLSSTWGTFKVGRQYSPSFNAAATMDLFGVAGVGSNYVLAATTTRVNNSLRYESPNMSGFSAAVLFGLGDNGLGTFGSAGTATAQNNESAGGQDAVAINKNAGQHQGLNLAYANGPFSAIYGYGVNNSVTLVGTSVVKTKSNVITGAYNFGPGSIRLGWASYKDDAAVTALDRRTWMIGGTFNVGAGSIRAQYGSLDNKLVANNDVRHWALGYVHPMSKRTTAYVTYAKTDNKEGSVAGAGAGMAFTGGGSAIVGNGATAADTRFDPSSFQFGMNHSF